MGGAVGAVLAGAGSLMGRAAGLLGSLGSVGVRQPEPAGPGLRAVRDA